MAEQPGVTATESGSSASRRAVSPTLMLVLVTLLWGLSFPLMKTWQEAAAGCPGGMPVATFTLIAVRMVLALAGLAVFLPRLYAAPTRRELKVGTLIGGIFFLGFALQVLGLAWTTPAMSSFITSLGSAWVPLLAWLFFGARLRGEVLAGMSLGVGGTVILGLTDLEGGGLGTGEVLTLVASWVFAVEILVLDRLGRTVQSAHLTVPFLATTGVLATALAAGCAATGAGWTSWLAWTAAMLKNGAVLRDVLLLAVLSTVLAFHWMNVYQPRVSATRAALVYLLEPVFGTAFSILLGRDALTVWLVLGGALILGGNLVVELPGLRGSRRAYLTRRAGLADRPAQRYDSERPPRADPPRTPNRRDIMEPALFDDLQHQLAREGPAVAVDRLCDLLRERKDYGHLFYALLLKKRFELGVSPIPTGPSQDIPEALHESYEEGIRAAAREVGRRLLDEGNIPQAWMYYRMIGEAQPVFEALEKYQPGEGEDIQPVVEIAYHHGVHPRKGFDLILNRYGICNAITTVTGQDQSVPAEVRDYCLQRLVRALYAELGERLRAEIERKEGAAPATHSIRELLAGRDWLFEDGSYHIDMSHLSSVVQMSTYLPPGEELRLARELCAYGQRLDRQFQYPGDPPFEDQYRDYAAYLALLAGDDVEENLAHFRAKVENADPEAGTRPAEVLVNLLLHLNRPAEAVDVARRYVPEAGASAQFRICPSLPELCRRAGDYRTLATAAREQGDPVHYLAALLAGPVT